MERLTSEELNKVVGSLIGFTEPAGDSFIDETRLANTELLIGLVDHLMSELVELQEYKDKYEYSVKLIGEKAYNCLKEWHDSLDDIFEF